MGASFVDLESWISDLMKKEGITQYKTDVSGNTKKGEGYLGEVTFVKVTASSEKVGEIIYNLTIKSAKKSDEFRKQTPIEEAYQREIFMYTKVFPIFHEFEVECALENYFCKFAKCYSVCNENKKESVILENLKVAGFEVHDRKIVHNLNHALLVFQNYGKYHAISLALKTKKAALFKTLTKNMTHLMGLFMTQCKMVPTFINDFKFGIDILGKKGKETLAAKFEGFEDGMEDYLINYPNSSNPQSVILHGDCWNNNMMFKYEDGNTDQPVDLRFIDFQLSTVASPVCDLSYYLYCCTDRTVLNNFDSLLQTYYSSLTASLKEFGCNSEEIITMRELKDHWKKYSMYGFSLAPFFLKIALCESDEVVDFADSVEKGEVNNAFGFKLRHQDLYEQRILDVYSHYAENFL